MMLMTRILPAADIVKFSIFNAKIAEEIEYNNI